MTSLTPFHRDVSRFLSSRKKTSLLRSPIEILSQNGPSLETVNGVTLSFASNDYLGLSSHPSVREALCDFSSFLPLGSGGSRLICGSHRSHLELERKLSLFKNTESTLLFSSGFMANLAAVSSFADEETIIYSDERNHASIIDACRLAKASVVVFRHLDPSDLKTKLSSSPPQKKKILVTDSVFSTDGSLAPLQEYSLLSSRYSCLFIVDEAHATGVLGPSGRGLCASLGISPHIQVSTLSKTFGLSGGFLSTDDHLRTFLLNKARSFIFTTAPPLPISKAALKSLEIVASSEGDSLREKLEYNCNFLSQNLNSMGFSITSHSHILSIPFSSPSLSLKASRFLFEHGIFVLPFRPPTVPSGKSLLRVAPSALHTSQHLDSFLSSFRLLKTHLDKGTL
jgi:8-amino-7-oxononanoate synthase